MPGESRSAMPQSPPQPSGSASPIAQYLRELRALLSGLDDDTVPQPDPQRPFLRYFPPCQLDPEAQALLEEARLHLTEAARELALQGLSPYQSEAEAVRRFGPPAAIAAALRRTGLRGEEAEPPPGRNRLRDLLSLFGLLSAAFWWSVLLPYLAIVAVATVWLAVQRSTGPGLLMPALLIALAIALAIVLVTRWLWHAYASTLERITQAQRSMHR
jgi:uncharacterized membrane protein